ncbi:FAD-dependent tricarballylate dehydrogenase TcuA [Sciscionella marina]|uniref:FAD-dependent tricarballylate dehydrogenase TcuA n=1 Tax=Sciscionella marina TaxID=508770 RepID=UPI000373BF0C|nr:FAD-dependent tricarballylate dehydrogenase TcuA [Sciscionella marina]
MPKVVVAGAGLAGLTAAISAREAGANVVLLEKGDRTDVGGNAAFSGGLFLFCYDGPADLTSITQDYEAGMWADRIEAPPYTTEAYTDELMAMSNGRADPQLVRALTNRSLDTVRWLTEKGVRFTFNRTVGAHVREGILHIPPGQILTSTGNGMSRGFEVIKPLVRRAEQLGVEFRWSTPLVEVLRSNGRAVAAAVGDDEPVPADALVITSGGFQANTELRRRYLGPEWENVKLRGTRLATGDGLTAALRAGAGEAGTWASCHSAAVDPTMPSPGCSEAAPPFPLHGFWLGVLVNRDGERFVDEGPGPWVKNYSKMGKAIMRQPGCEAYEIFDQRTAKRVADEFAGDAVPIVAATVPELAERIGTPADALVRTIKEFNRACQDSRTAKGITPPKSQDATPLDHPPFVAYHAVAGLTFTFGGVRIDPNGRALDPDGVPVPGLYAAGEATGGLFYGDYPGGAALMRAAVFGRAAGRTAAIEGSDSAGLESF